MLVALQEQALDFVEIELAGVAWINLWLLERDFI